MIRLGDHRILARPRFPEPPSASRLGATMHAQHRVSLIRVQSDTKDRQGLGDDDFAVLMWACACNPSPEHFGLCAAEFIVAASRSLQCRFQSMPGAAIEQAINCPGFHADSSCAKGCAQPDRHRGQGHC